MQSVNLVSNTCEDEYREIKLVRDGSRDLKFRGKLLAKVETSPNNAHSSYSGSTGIWAELTLYEAKNGKYICHWYHGTLWEGMSDRSEAMVCDTPDQVFDFFGARDIAKRLYEEAGLDFVEELEDQGGSDD